MTIKKLMEFKTQRRLEIVEEILRLHTINIKTDTHTRETLYKLEAELQLLKV